MRPHLRPRTFCLLALPFAASCGLFDEELPPVEHSPGFYAEFEEMVESATASGSDAEKASRLRRSFALYFADGPGEGEAHALGESWEKVEAFLEIGLRTADVMADVEGAAPNRVAMYTTAADRVLRTDLAALEAWNREVREMGRADAVLDPTGDEAWASLELVMAESEHATVQRWIESGEWIEGHYERGEGHYEQIWIPGYFETVWQEGACWDEYVGTDCESAWVDGRCYDEYVDDGYWESYCSEYDEWGSCVAWTDSWVDNGYWVTTCESGTWFEDCWDIYETLCEEGRWVDVWVDGTYTRGPWIPGETYWVEGYWEDTSGYRPVVLVVEESEILAEGIAIVLERGGDDLGARCRSGLESALDSSAELPADEAGEALRDAVLSCLTEASPE